MTTFRRLLATLILWVNVAFAPDPIHYKNEDADRLAGYHGYLTVPPTGDWLTTTYCWCADENKNAPGAEEAMYMQHDYYNFHQNATYIYHFGCLAHASDYETCNDDSDLGFEGHPHASYLGQVRCQAWDPWDYLGAGPKYDHKDRLCLGWGDQRLMFLGDQIFFNGQVRVLNDGSEGAQPMPLQEANRICEPICQHRYGLPILGDRGKVKNAQTIYSAVDDMCDGCP